MTRSPSESGAHSRRDDLRAALGLTYLTLAWMTLEGVASLWLGARSRSLLLEGFGLDSILELVSAAVLLWRLRSEWRGGRSEAQTEALERRAARWVGYTLFILAASVTWGAVYGLTHHRATDTLESVWGIGIGLTAKIGMPVLAGYKLKIAARLGSCALRADAMEAVTCGYLSVVLTLGLTAARLLPALWGLDSVAALALVPFLLKEGREAVTGECDCQSH